MKITNSLLDENMVGGWLTFRGSGGAIFNQGDLILDNVTFSNNVAHMGGAITHQAGELEMRQVVFDNNEAKETGGAIHLPNYKGEVKFDGAVFADNYASDKGGAIFNCPTGKALFNMSNSIATFDNKAETYGATIGKAKNITNEIWLNVSKYSLSGFRNDIYLDTPDALYQPGVSTPIDQTIFDNDTLGLKVITKGKTTNNKTS